MRIFPKVREDGTFCVRVVLSIATQDAAGLRADLQRWMSKWGQDKEVWERQWRSGRMERLLYSDDFKAAPTIEISDASELHLRVEGTSSARLWKDWLVSRILPDLKAAFSEIGEFKEMRDCQ